MRLPRRFAPRNDSRERGELPRNEICGERERLPRMSCGRGGELPRNELRERKGSRNESRERKGGWARLEFVFF